MARLACLGSLTVMLVAAPAFGQAPPDAKAPSSDDYVLVYADFLSDAVLRPEFKLPQGTIIDSQKSSCGDAARTNVRGFSRSCVVHMKLRVPRSRLDEVKALIERVQERIIFFGPSTKF